MSDNSTATQKKQYKRNAEYSKAFQELCDQYRNGEISKDEYILEFTKNMTPYIKRLCLPFPLNDREDMESACVEIICKFATDYDPSSGNSATTFLTPKFRDAMRKALKGDPYTAQSYYYMNKIKAYNETLESWGIHVDISDPGVTIDEALMVRLAKATDTKLSTIKETIAQAHNSVCSFEAITENNDMVSNIYKDPAQAYAEKELKDMLENALSRLLPVERQVFELVKLENLSFSQVAEILDIENPSPAKVSNIYCKARAKLFQMSSLRKIRGYNVSELEEEADIVSAEDIDNMMATLEDF